MVDYSQPPLGRSVSFARGGVTYRLRELFCIGVARVAPEGAGYLPDCRAKQCPAAINATARDGGVSLLFSTIEQKTAQMCGAFVRLCAGVS
jgi:hypothetical protein